MDDWTAALDQAKAGLADFAEMLAKYRGELMKHGFTREEALVLITAFQTVQLSRSAT